MASRTRQAMLRGYFPNAISNLSLNVLLQHIFVRNQLSILLSEVPVQRDPIINLFSEFSARNMFRNCFSNSNSRLFVNGFFQRRGEGGIFMESMPHRNPVYNPGLLVLSNGRNPDKTMGDTAYTYGGTMCSTERCWW